MIKTERNNMPVGAPRVMGLSELLADYRTSVDDPSATQDEMVAFLSVPSAARDRFLNGMTEQSSIESGKYVVRIFTKS